MSDDDGLPPGYDEIVTPLTDKPKPKPRLKLLRGKKALTRQSMGTVIRGFLHAGSLTLVYGPPKSGKSFLVTDALLSVAAGDPDWMGRRIVRSGPVLYVACEGHAGFWKRLTAAKDRRGLFDFPDDFVLACGRPHLITPDPKAHNVMLPRPQDIKEAVDEIKPRPVVVAIDTVFRAIGPGNVNNADHINAFLQAIGTIMDLGIAVVCVHHEVKAGGTPAGSVSLMGGADTIVKTQNLGGNEHSWEVEFSKDDAISAVAHKFALEVVELGTDEDNEPAASCVVVARDGPVEPQRTRGTGGWSQATRLLKKALMNVLVDQGYVTHPRPDMSALRVVDLEIVRHEFYRDYPAADTPAKNRAFNRAINAAKDKNLVGTDSTGGITIIWLAQTPQPSMDL